MHRSLRRSASTAGWVARALAALLLVGCGGSPAPDARTPASTEAASSCGPDVSLRFAWPDAVRGRVHALDLTESANADGSAPMRGESRSELALVGRRDGDRTEVRFEVVGDSRTRSQGFGPDIGGVRPTVVLDATGAPVAVQGVEAMRERLSELHRSQQIDDESAQLIAPNLTDEAQLETARSHWRWVTEVWNGRELRCGEAVTDRVRVPAMALGRAALDADLRLLYEGSAPCPSAPDRTCVTLRAELTADPMQAAAEMSMSGARLLSGRIDRKIRVTVEPASLLLHAVSFEERQRLEWEYDGGRSTRHVRDVQSYEVDYRM